MNTLKDFIKEYHPRYETSNDIESLDALEEIKNNNVEEGSYAHSLLVDVYMDCPDNPRLIDDYQKILIRVYEQSIKGYINSL